MRLIYGSGPTSAELMVVGSGPGYEEDRDGTPFVGKTGAELSRFLDGSTLPSRHDVFLTNLYRFYGGKDYVYTDEDLKLSEPYLLKELKRVKPAVVLTMGRDATRWFLGDVDMDDVQGIPWLMTDEARAKLPFLDAGTVIFPIIHVAAGFHNPELSPYVVDGFSRLAEYFSGAVPARKLYDDPIPGPDYEEITSIERLDEVLRQFDELLPTPDTQRTQRVSSGKATSKQRGRVVKGRARQGLERDPARGPDLNLSIDTEGSVRRPWSVQFSDIPGRGYVIASSRRDLLARFGQYLLRRRPRLTFHSALHDLGMNRALGLPLDLPFDDTMVMAYLLQLEPQGLKALCVRHCNMRMNSYMSVLGDAGQRLAVDYLAGLWDIENAEWEERREQAFWTEIELGRKIRVQPTVPKTQLHKAVERALRSKDARKLWLDQVEDVQVAGYHHLGDMPEPTLSHIPRADAVYYAARDSDGTSRVRPELERRLDALGLRGVYELELSTYPLIERMAYIGLKPDLDHFARLSAFLQTEIDGAQAKLVTATGLGTFNANSGDQVADYVFDGLGLVGGKKTRTGRFSTNDKILEALEKEHPEHPVLTDIRAYREYYKLKNTFVDRLPDFVRRYPFDGRVHATFRTTRVITGRLAASDPNILAMPKHGKFATEFRRGWTAGDGHWLGEWDLSQIELRVLAHLSQDPVLLAVFRGERRNADGSKVDLHANLAQRIFGGKPEDHAKGTGRLAAKAINFGLPMGMTNKGLAVELRKNGVYVTEDDAQKWIDDTFSLYKGVPIYQDQKAAEATRNGYVRCLSGRIRYIGGSRSRDERVREEAKRFAFSTPVQEGAQWLMKQAEAKVWTMLQGYWEQGVWIEPLAQVHDALTLEFTADEQLARELNTRMVAIMTAIPTGFSVPVETSGDYGFNWSTFGKDNPDEHAMKGF